MATKTKDPRQHTAPFIDPAIPLPHKKRMLLHALSSELPQTDEMLKSLFESAAANNADVLANAKLSELNEHLNALQEGPLRAAMFDRMLSTKTSPRRARLLTEDGSAAYSVVLDADLAAKLRCGDTVLLDNQGRAVVDIDPDGEWGLGEVAKIERRIGRDRIEASIRDFERSIYRASERLIEQLDSGEANIGSQVIVHVRRRIALDVVPAAEGLSHFRFLARDPVPDVIAERDIGSPPAYIAELLEHLVTEMRSPELSRKYRLRRSQTKLLYGVSGTGKSLSVHALWNGMYQVMSDVTGVPIDALPHRVMKLRMPKVLSKWLGDSDKHLDRFFDEVEQLSAEKFLTPDGREFELPVLVIGEEIDGLARSRGLGDPVYDRIQTTALERLDTNYARLQNALVLFVFTTNVPQLVDPAFLRRAGGTAERFGRLDRRSFGTVLSKHVRGLPLSRGIGSGKDAERHLVRHVTDWLYSPNGHDPGQVQVTYVGSSTPEMKFRYDFLTGALVDRAVQQAAREARRVERSGCDDPGLTPQAVIEACTRQIRTIVDQITEFNLGEYVSLPEGARVGTVRRIEQPHVSPLDLERP
jgi:ATP-dependent 26S proteasome regulatory subunit